jgi:hypothetical protein
MISSKDKKSPTSIPKRSTGSRFKSNKDNIGMVKDVQKYPMSFLQRQLGSSVLQVKLESVSA